MLPIWSGQTKSIECLWIYFLHFDLDKREKLVPHWKKITLQLFFEPENCSEFPKEHFDIAHFEKLILPYFLLLSYLWIVWGEFQTGFRCISGRLRREDSKIVRFSLTQLRILFSWPTFWKNLVICSAVKYLKLNREILHEFFVNSVLGSKFR